jgi:hypothetical protein
MPKALRKTSAVGPRRARAGSAVELTDTLGLLAATLARASELPGRIADAAELCARLEAHRDDLRVCLARARFEAATSAQLGRHFGARRASTTAVALDEEIQDVEAMLDEVARVRRRLRREARSIDLRLQIYASRVAELPLCAEREHMLALVDRARIDLCGARTAAGAIDAAYTLSRGELKQTGQAR